ncbi:hypothetical protein ABKV19_026271 [Rosa sericea]
MRKNDDYSWNHRVESYKFIWFQMNMRLTGISIESQIHQMVGQRSVGLWNGRWKTAKIRLENCPDTCAFSMAPSRRQLFASSATDECWRGCASLICRNIERW